MHELIQVATCTGLILYIAYALFKLIMKLDEKLIKYAHMCYLNYNGKLILL